MANFEQISQKCGNFSLRIRLLQQFKTYDSESGSGWNIETPAGVDSGTAVCVHLEQGFPNCGSRPLAGSCNKLQGSQEVYKFCAKYCVFPIYTVVLIRLKIGAFTQTFYPSCQFWPISRLVQNSEAADECFYVLIKWRSCRSMHELFCFVTWASGGTSGCIFLFLPALINIEPQRVKQPP